MATDLLTKGLPQITKKASALGRLVIEYAAIDSIKPNGYNPNRQSEKEFAMLQESMQTDGFTQPIIVQRASREIVDGEHRWRAARAKGLETVPIVLVDMTEEQMRISTLRHNRARGSEDLELSTQVLKDLRELGALDWAQDALKLSDLEMNVLINDVPVSEALAADQFTEGWAPARNQPTGEGRSEVSMSEQAKELNVKLNERLESAKTSEEQQAIEAERRASTFRVSVIFSKEDAALVRRVLAPKPVERLLALALAYKQLIPA